MGLTLVYKKHWIKIYSDIYFKYKGESAEANYIRTMVHLSSLILSFD